MAARDTTIAFWEDEICLQSLSNHMMSNHNFHQGIEVGFKDPQGMEICNMDGSRLFLKKYLEAGLPVEQGVAMLESHLVIRVWNSAIQGQSMLAL